jgi:ferredoxin
MLARLWLDQTTMGSLLTRINGCDPNLSPISIFICARRIDQVDVDTAILQGMTAAARAARFVQQGKITHGGASAWVDSQICTGCAQCVETCAADAIRMTSPTAPLLPGEGNTSRSVIDPFLCLGCGNCVVECPSKAIDLPSVSDAQILAQIQAALAAVHDGAKPALVFACSWSGFAAMELVARRLTCAANIRVIDCRVLRSIPPYLAFYWRRKSYARVCPPNECHFGSQSLRKARKPQGQLAAQDRRRGSSLHE